MGRHGVAIVSMAISAVIAVWGVWRPEQMTGSALALTTFALQKLDWLFMGACTLFLFLSLFLAIGPYGKIKLGADDEEPEFDTLSWLCHDVRRRDGGRAPVLGRGRADLPLRPAAGRGRAHRRRGAHGVRHHQLPLGPARLGDLRGLLAGDRLLHLPPRRPGHGLGTHRVLAAADPGPTPDADPLEDGGRRRRARGGLRHRRLARHGHLDDPHRDVRGVRHARRQHDEFLHPPRDDGDVPDLGLHRGRQGHQVPEQLQHGGRQDHHAVRAVRRPDDVHLRRLRHLDRRLPEQHHRAVVPHLRLRRHAAEAGPTAGR